MTDQPDIDYYQYSSIARMINYTRKMRCGDDFVEVPDQIVLLSFEYTIE